MKTTYKDKRHSIFSMLALIICFTTILTSCGDYSTNNAHSSTPNQSSIDFSFIESNSQETTEELEESCSVTITEENSIIETNEILEESSIIETTEDIEDTLPIETTIEITTEEIATITPTTIAPTTIASTQPPATYNYVLNTNTKKFHLPSCSSVEQIKEEHKEFFTGTNTEAEAKGYSPCQKCSPGTSVVVTPTTEAPTTIAPTTVAPTTKLLHKLPKLIF